mgnify:FL=1|tara:strand:+ start:245 stop:967 length:723 start_codon:yes stop_codon:yes gene_type:complete
MSKFFKSFEFKVKDDPSIAIPLKLVVWDLEKLAEIEADIELEITKIKNGTSLYLKRAIDPGGFGFPAQNAIRIFVKKPSDKSFPGIKAIARQDWGPQASVAFAAKLNAARSEIENPARETVKANPAAFRESVGGFFYDLLRSAGITMLPGNSFERIREIGEKLGGSIEHAAQSKAIESVNSVQTETQAAFEKVEQEFVKHKSVLVALASENELLRERLDVIEGNKKVAKLPKKFTSRPGI